MTVMYIMVLVLQAGLGDTRAMVALDQHPVPLAQCRQAVVLAKRESNRIDAYCMPVPTTVRPEP